MDEVEQAKKAATANNPSNNDGVGSTTVFDKILSGEWSCNKAYEDDLCLAFHDVSPQARTHIFSFPNTETVLQDPLTPSKNKKPCWVT